MPFPEIVNLIIIISPLLIFIVWNLFFKNNKNNEKSEQNSFRFLLIMLTILLSIPLIVFKIHFWYLLYLSFIINIIIPVYLKKSNRS